MSDAPGEPEVHPLIRLYAWGLVVGLPLVPAIVALRGAGGRLSVHLVGLQLTGAYAGWAAPVGLAAVLLSLACLAASAGAGPVRIACLGPLCLLGYAILLALVGTFVFAPGAVAGAPVLRRVFFLIGGTGLNVLLVTVAGAAYLLPLAPWKRLRAGRPGQSAALAFFLTWGYAVGSFFKLLLGTTG